jgi:transposase
MRRFVEGEDRRQGVLLPEYLDDYVSEENQVRVIEAFVEELDLAALGFEGVSPATTGRPSYHPSVLLKIYVYGYLNQIASSRRLERRAVQFSCKLGILSTKLRSRAARHRVLRTFRPPSALIKL